MLVSLFLNAKLVRSVDKCICTGDTCADLCGDKTIEPTLSTFDDASTNIFALTTVTTLDVSAQTNTFSIETTKDSKLVLENVEKIGFTEGGLVFGKVTLTSPTVTLKLKSGVKTLKLEGTRPSSTVFTDTSTTLELTAKLAIEGTLESTAAFITVTASTANTLVAPHDGLAALKTVFKAGTNVVFKEADSVCIGTDPAQDLAACQSVDGNEDFYTVTALPATIPEGKVVVSLLDSLTIGADFVSKVTFKPSSAPKAGAFVVENAQNLAFTTNKVTVNKLFNIATDYVTFNVPGDMLVLSCDAAFGATANTKIVVAVDDVSFNTVEVTQALTCTVDKVSTVAKAVVTCSFGFTNVATLTAGSADVTVQAADAYCLSTTGRTPCSAIFATGKFELLATLPATAPTTMTVLYNAIDNYVLPSSIFKTTAVTIHQAIGTHIQVDGETSFTVDTSGFKVGTQITVDSGNVIATLADSEMTVTSGSYTTVTPKATIKLLKTMVLATFAGSKPTTAEIVEVTSDEPATLVKKIGTTADAFSVLKLSSQVTAVDAKAKAICTAADKVDDASVTCKTGDLTKWEGIYPGDEVTISIKQAEITFDGLFQTTVQFSSGAAVTLTSSTSKIEVSDADELTIGEDNILKAPSGVTGVKATIPLSEDPTVKTIISGSGTLTEMTVILGVTVDHCVVDVTSLSTKPTLLKADTSITTPPTVGVMPKASLDFISSVTAAKVKIEAYEETPYYCFGDETTCKGENVYPYTYRITATMAEAKLDSTYSLVLKSYVTENTYNISQLAGAFEFSYEGTTAADGSISLTGVSKLSNTNAAEIVVANSQTTLGTITASKIGLAEVNFDGNEVEFDITQVPTIKVNVNLMVAGGEYEITGSVVANSNVKLNGEAIITKDTNGALDNMVVSPLIKTAAVEATLQRIIICPTGQDAKCIAEVKKIDADVKADTSIIYDPITWNPNVEYNPTISTRQALPAYVYLGFEKEIEAYVSLLKIEKQVPVPIPVSTAAITLADPKTVDLILYKEATDMTLAPTQVTMKSGDNNLLIDAAHAPKSLDVEIGDRLNVASGDATEQSEIKVTLKMAKAEGILAFDKVNANGPKFVVDVPQGTTLKVFTGTSKQADMAGILEVTGSGSATYTEGTPENPIIPTTAKKGLSAGAIAGIVIACVVVVAAAVVIPIVVIQMKKKKAAQVGNAPA